MSWPRAIGAARLCVSPTAPRPVTHVVTENCINCKHTECVEVCPVDCFNEGSNFLVIDPESCIDCTMCVAECQVGAIYPEDEEPRSEEHTYEIQSLMSHAYDVLCLKTTK